MIMEPKRIVGKIASQPVVVSSDREFTVLVLIQTDSLSLSERCVKFYATEPITCHIDVGRYLSCSVLSDVLLSSVGDNVELDIATDDVGCSTRKIINFRNITRSFGHVITKL